MNAKPPLESEQACSRSLRAVSIEFPRVVVHPHVLLEKTKQTGARMAASVMAFLIRPVIGVGLFL